MTFAQEHHVATRHGALLTLVAASPHCATRFQRQNGPVDFALATDFHFLLPTSLGRTLADCSIDKPAQMSGIKLPCGTILPVLDGAMPRQPARLILLGSMVFQSKNKEDLTFDMHRHVPPTLFETLNGLKRNAQNLCHLALRFSQMSSNFCELLFLHPGFFPCRVFHRSTAGHATDPHSPLWSVRSRISAGLPNSFDFTRRSAQSDNTTL